MFRPLIFLLALGFLSACVDQSPRQELSGATMGTTWSVIYASVDGLESSLLHEQIEAELIAINDALSTYIPESEISRFNDADGPIRMELSSRFATVLDAALRIGSLTGGAYDVTVGPLIELWGFGSRDFSGRAPSATDIANAASMVGASQLAWDPVTAMLERPAGVRIDLSSVAKGYAVDRISELLVSQGVENSLVEIGGELRARGQRPEGGPWQLAVESPDPESGRFIEALTISDAAVATSGDYRNYFEVEGTRYSHLVDPRTGYPVAHDLVSVTVVHELCMDADALATALIVMGREKAIELASREQIAAHFVSRAGDGLDVHYTPAFEAFRRPRVDQPAPTNTD